MYLKTRAERVLRAAADFTAALLAPWKSISVGWGVEMTSVPAPINASPSPP